MDVLVTGAGSGVGAAIATAFLRDGHRVALTGRRTEALKQTARDAADALAGAGDADNALVVGADVTVPAEVEGLFSTIRQAWGRLDLLVNNAGTFGRTAPVEEFEYDVWRQVLDTNLTGAFLCAQQAFRLMKEQRPQGGRIINNGSLSAHTPRPNAIAYTASKHAMTGLTKQLSLEGRQYRIACGQIDIGNAATDMAGGFSQGTLQADGSLMPEPLMDVAHVVEAVRYMAGLPLEANVQSMTVLATTMPSFVGRG